MVLAPFLAARPTMAVSNSSLKTSICLRFHGCTVAKWRRQFERTECHANGADYREKWPTKIAPCLLNAFHANYLGVGSRSFIVLAVFMSAGAQEESSILFMWFNFEQYTFSWGGEMSRLPRIVSSAIKEKARI